jgi:glycosyltransferase involved in cell wall biosynthesis
MEHFQDETTSKSQGLKLAVVIPCYNYASFVGRAISSVVDQAHQECEIVVVDDGSTDQSWEVIEQTGVRAFRITNCGARSACLYGFDRTTAPFVLFLDADDELKPGSIAEIIRLLDAEVAKLQFSLSLIGPHGEHLSGSLSTLETFRTRHRLAQKVLKKGVYRSPPTSGNVFRRDVVELLREADYDKFVDGVMLFAAPFLGDVVSTSRELGRYRIHGRNDSGLGRLPDAASVQRDIDRFLLRMNHLRLIVERLTLSAELVAPRKTFYFREHILFLDIASDKRPQLSALPGLLFKLMHEDLSIRSKLILAVFYSLSSTLPSSKGKVLLAYRLKAGRRSIIAFAFELFGFAGSSPTVVSEQSPSPPE